MKNLKIDPQMENISSNIRTPTTYQVQTNSVPPPFCLAIIYENQNVLY